MDDAEKLIAAGFEYICACNEAMLFRRGNNNN
jgi:hypothetical protein